MASILTLRRPGLLFTQAANLQEQEIRSKDSPPVEHGLQCFEELPSWYHGHPLVRSGYRPVSNSSFSCLYSWTFLHNETVNIYSHLVPAILSVFAQFSVQVFISHQFPQASTRDRLVFSANILAATTMLTLSSMYHTLMNHSHQVSSLWLRFDYVGILAEILGSLFSGIYVGFYCEPLLQRLYWSTSISFSVITSILVLHPVLQGRQYRPLRTAAFIVTAVSGFAPIAHGVWLYGWEDMWARFGMPYWVLEFLVYGLGAFFFVTRMPESLWPGKFDIWFSSHQIFHVLVVLASGVHFIGVWETYNWNYQNTKLCVVKF